MSVSVKMSRKNQIVVPKAAREALGLVGGDRLIVTLREDGVVELEKKPADPGRLLEGLLRGMAADAEPAAEGAGALWAELGGGS